ncbi:MFS transporter [Nonomuraea sp. K274]|uniref:MFS transporter n=1 Tax=Nonomuraea cypriaca TaxID=1187855 RepID=A0A931F3B0_9ACTN|nr:MFS transporter [Nonomuraea cypriaca]MBF8189951.1 MFS transporter [Nonomuraea cypriaca]
MSAPASPWYRQLSRQHWHALAGSWLGWTLDGFDFILITYVLTDIATEFEVSLTTAGTLVLATFATRWLGGAFIGSFADRFGRKTAMIASVLLYSFATFLCGLSWDFWSLMIFRLVVGIGMAGEYAAGSTLLLESWPERVRNKASGFLVSGWAAGGLLAAAVYAPIVTAFGWRGLFFVGIAPALLTIYIRFGVAEPEEWRSAADRDEAPKVSFFQLLSRRWLPVAAALFGLMFANFATTWPILSLMPTYLKSTGYDEGATGTLMFVASLGALFGYWASGFLGDRIGTRRALIWVMALSLVFVATTFAVTTAGSVVLAVSLFLVEFTSLGITGLLPKYIADHFDPTLRASGLGTTYNLGSIAGGLSPVWGGALAGVIGLGSAIGVLTAFWTLACIAVIGFDLPRRALGRAMATQPTAVHN